VFYCAASTDSEDIPPVAVPFPGVFVVRLPVFAFDCARSTDSEDIPPVAVPFPGELLVTFCAIAIIGVADIIIIIDDKIQTEGFI
jgi:hypothetical protein